MKELYTCNVYPLLQVVFTASFAWVQLTVATPLLLQLLLTVSLAQHFASLSRHLESIVAHCRAQVAPLRQESSVSSPCNCSTSLHKIFISTSGDLELGSGVSRDQLRQRWATPTPSLAALRELAKNHHRLAALCGQLSEALGPLLALSHLYLVYTIIMAIFTLVFDFTVRCHQLTSGSGRRGCVNVPLGRTCRQIFPRTL